MGKYWELLKDEGCYVCKCHGEKFPTKSDVVKHDYTYRKEQGTLAPGTIHRTGACEKDSRKCEMCHPEAEIGLSDCKMLRELAIWNYPIEQRVGMIHNTVCILLTSENRYRHKLHPYHWAQIDALDRKTLWLEINKRVRKRLAVKPDNDGYQTPYIKHGIDVACHTTAICCRGCLMLSCGVPMDRDMTEEEINLATNTCWAYLHNMVTPGSQLRNWMTYMENKTPEGYFYIPGVYKVVYENGAYIPYILSTETIQAGTEWYKIKHKRQDELRRKYGESCHLGLAMLEEQEREKK